jgi:hypothetical protein
MIFIWLEISFVSDLMRLAEKKISKSGNRLNEVSSY